MLIFLRHMSKHERQHSISHTVNTTVSNEKRARLINMNMDYSTHTNQNEKMQLNDYKTSFSTCFSADKVLIPDEKQSLE